MTFVRRLAVRCAAFLVRRASPGWKEWAEGLRREMEFIESDWQALTWILNGMWVLLDYRPCPIRSFDDLHEAAGKFAEKQRYKVNDVWLARNMGWFCWAVQIFNLSLGLLTEHHDARTWLGWSLKLAGMLTFLVYGFLSRAEPVVPDRDDALGMIEFYKAGLEHLCKVTGPVTLVAIVFISAGYVLSPLRLGNSLVLAIWFVLPVVGYWGYRIQLRKLHEVRLLLE